MCTGAHTCGGRICAPLQGYPSFSLVGADLCVGPSRQVTCVQRMITDSRVTKKRAHHLARPEVWFKCVPWSTYLCATPIFQVGSGVSPAWEGGKGVKRAPAVGKRTGTIEARRAGTGAGSPGPLALAERAENNIRRCTGDNGMSRSAKEGAKRGSHPLLSSTPSHGIISADHQKKKGPILHENLQPQPVFRR